MTFKRELFQEDHSAIPQDDVFLFHENYQNQKGESEQFLRQILKEHFNLENFILERTKTGKPFIQGGPHFNLSHSHNKIVLAVSLNGSVGVDIEYIRPRPKFQKLMQRHFTKEEQEFVGDSLEKFYDLWTQKEALVKCLGKSILSTEFKHHGQINTSYHPIKAENFKGCVCFSHYTKDPI
ncbi:MAG: 4'-phosphopantetheinyl transferase superfamily protein [Alphaproteobacteria bacterium]|nr:MAG: 4'-phosphopantetheinyl transferase superfamily protein [Alphaproteobacteria bacterium]